MKNFIIGPSHISIHFTHQIQYEIDNKILFDNCILDGYPGLPVWSQHCHDMIRKHSDTHNIFWIVSDYKFNNFDYPKIIELQKTKKLFLETIGSPGNVSRDFLSTNHIELLGDHSLEILDYTIKEFPEIKLIFWCLYKRSKVNNSSYPKNLWYDSIKQKYEKNIVDIDCFTSPEEFSKKIKDDGGHPNKDGFILLDKMIKAYSY